MTFASRNIRPYVVSFLANVGNSGTGSYGVRAWGGSVNFGSFTPTIPYFKGNGVIELYAFPDADKLYLSMQTPPVNGAMGDAPPVDTFDVLVYNGVQFLRTDATPGVFGTVGVGSGAMRRWEWTASGQPLTGTIPVSIR